MTITDFAPGERFAVDPAFSGCGIPIRYGTVLEVVDCGRGRVVAYDHEPQGRVHLPVRLMRDLVEEES